MGITWLPLLFVAIGALLAAVGVRDLARKRRFVREAARTTGTIVGYEARAGRRGSVYHPVVDFPLPTGQLVRFTSSVGSSPRVGQVGQPVGVLFNPYNPGEAELDHGFYLWGLGVILSVLGGFFVVFGALFLLCTLATGGLQTS